MAYQVKNRVWIENENGPFLAEGRISLLKLIVQTGSISKAAKEMKMSYKKAWELVNSMNKNSKKDLLSKSIGGKSGGGTTLTDYGHEVIKKFEILNLRSQEAVELIMKDLDF